MLKNVVQYSADLVDEDFDSQSHQKVEPHSSANVTDKSQESSKYHVGCLVRKRSHLSRRLFAGDCNFLYS